MSAFGHSVNEVSALSADSTGGGGGGGGGGGAVRFQPFQPMGVRMYVNKEGVGGAIQSRTGGAMSPPAPGDAHGLSHDTGLGQRTVHDATWTPHSIHHLFAPIERCLYKVIAYRCWYQ